MKISVARVGVFADLGQEVSDSWGRMAQWIFLWESGREHCTATLVLTEAQFDGLLGNDDRVVIASSRSTTVSLVGHRHVPKFSPHKLVA